MEFQLNAPYKPTGDQPEAIRQLVDGLNKGMKHQVLLGLPAPVRPSPLANIIQQLQMPALVMAHNKTLRPVVR